MEGKKLRILDRDISLASTFATPGSIFTVVHTPTNADPTKGIDNNILRK
jgi:hypothetical protein